MKTFARQISDVAALNMSRAHLAWQHADGALTV